MTGADDPGAEADASQPAWRARARRVGTVVIIVGSAVAMFLAGRLSWLLVLSAFLFVVAVGRCDMPWLSRNSATRIIRRSIRILVYVPPVFVAGIPFLRFSPLALLTGALIGGLPLLLELRSFRIMFGPAYLSVATISRTERTMDVILFGSSGIVQEYLYRGLFLAVALRIDPPVAIIVSAVAFILEHALHPDGLTRWYDVRDLAIQGYLSLTLATLVWVTGSLPAAMLGHTIYNLPNLLLALRRPAEGKQEPEQDGRLDAHPADLSK